MKIPSCPICGGPGVLLGALGLLRWFRCRACGTDFKRQMRRRYVAGRCWDCGRGPVTEVVFWATGMRYKVCAEHCREYRQALKKGGTAQAPRS